jgi:hypothetical protein
MTPAQGFPNSASLSNGNSGLTGAARPRSALPIHAIGGARANDHWKRRLFEAIYLK